MRARRRMKEYDGNPMRPGAAQQQATRRALEQFLLYLGNRDAAGLERLLAADVISISDGGAEMNAARRPVHGRDKVLRLIIGLAAKAQIEPRFTIQVLNGLPSIVIEDQRSSKTAATRYTLHADIDTEGRISSLYAVLAPEKLSAVRFAC
jgi:RNA polymerase sigma-70 factor (ECF subfamily)